MESLFQQLKKARESQHRSLADVGAATRINPEFLRALEEGRTDMLPQAYVRAFLREYAEAVGLDPIEVMAQYDALKGQQSNQPSGTSPSVIVPRTPVEPASPPPTDFLPAGGRATIAIVLTALALAGIVYWNLSRPAPQGETQIPYLPVEPEGAVPDDTTTTHPQESPGQSDSLTLVAVTSDTVWVKIVADSRKPLQYVIPANARRVWKAKDRFTISVGRPEAIALTLNSMPLGRMGARGKSVLDSVITRATLEKLEQERKR